jgi:hypothetical protein
MIQVAAFGSGQTALGLTEDLQNGVIDRFRSLPMARSAVLAGRTGADLVRNAVVIGLMVLVGTLLGFRYQTSFVRFLAAFALALCSRTPCRGSWRPSGCRADPGGGAVRRVHPDLPAGVRLVGVPPDRDDAGVAARLRRQPAAHRRHQRDARADAR